MRDYITLVILIYPLFLNCTPNTEQELTIFAASSLTNAVREIKDRFEEKYSCSININLGSSGSLAQNIKRGVACQVFMSANAGYADELIESGKATGASRYVFATNSLVIITKKRAALTINTPQDLTKCKKLSIGEPSTVPAGTYAKQELIKLGLWEALKDKLVPANNVRATLGYVEGNIVDSGIVYKTDSMISQKIKVDYEFNPTGIQYVAVLVSGAQYNGLANKFIEYLKTDNCNEVFRKYGFK